MNEFHNSVLLKESVNGLNINPDGIYVDATFGGGGHSKAILEQLTNGQLIAFDQDKEAVKNKISNDNRFTMVNKNFSHLIEQLSLLNIFSIDGLIADLGVSGYHFTDNNRGFSLKYDSDLDMRMDQNLEKDGAYILNHYNSKNLIRMFKEHSDFYSPKSIVNAILNFREKQVIKTTFDFKQIFSPVVDKGKENKFFARLFQAIRIEVNDEINSLKELLKQSLEALNPSGRLVVISYHSIEDRLAKRFMRFGNFSNVSEKDFFGNSNPPFKIITKKPITPSEVELKVNKKSRSAKLRICQKL